ncbi:MAG: hypothetical protein H6747_14750 [Deltaproteobacteria bacterium]|nr:hypothetical protein [Deltaproteobacteria bacterium]
MWTRLLCGLLLMGLGVGCSAEPAAEAPCDGPAGTICTWIGTGDAGFDGDGNPLLQSQLYWPIDATIREDGRAWVLDWNNHRVRAVIDGKLQTVIGTDELGDGPPKQEDLKEPGADGTTVNLNHPTQFVPQADGTLMLVAWHNHKLRRYDPATGKVVVACGGAPGFKGDGGSAHDAQVDQPQAMAPDGKGGHYLLDQRNQVVRYIDAQGIISTIAGTPKSDGYAGDGGDPLAAKFSFPKGSNPPPGGWVTVGPDGHVYVSDTLNHRIRRIDLAQKKIETVVGTGTPGYGGDGGQGTAAQVNNPRKIVFGPDGKLYIGDEYNNRIRAWDPATGVVTTVVGTGEKGFSGDGGPAAEAQIYRPAGVAIGADGDLIVIDSYNHRLRRVIGFFGGK